MSIAQQALMELDSAHEFFNRSTRNLTEAHSTFAPAEGMMTVAQQVAQVAQTIDWFVEGAFRPEWLAPIGRPSTSRTMVLSTAFWSRKM